MNANSKPEAKEPISLPAEKKPNIWLVISIILAIALVGVIFTNYSGSENGGEEEDNIIESDTVGQTLLNFINEVYGAQIGTAVLSGVVVQSGLYEVKVSVIDSQTNQPIEQTIFITKDGKYFVPQIVDIEAVLGQFRTLQQQTPTQTPSVELEAVDGQSIPDEPSDTPTPVE